MPTGRTSGLDLEKKAFKFIAFECIWVGMVLFQQGVGSTGFTASPAFGHEIREFTDVAAGFKHSVRCNRGAGKLNHVSKLQPVVQPSLVHPRAHPAAHGAEIVEAFGAAVDFKGGEQKSSTPQHPAESFKPPFIGHDLRLIVRL